MPPYSLHGYGYGSPQAVYGTVTNTNPTPVVVPSTTTPSTTVPSDMSPTKPSDTTKPSDKTKGMGMGANLKIRVPAEARLFVDGRLTDVAGSERSFTTPPLALGQKFYYDLKAELMVDGTVVVEEKRVIVESGIELNESFPKLFAAVAGKPAVVAGK
jgi:uncharacterized protein (TIGR03000 family)